MPKTPKLKAIKPKSALEKPLQADFKGLFKALTKGVTHSVVGKWEELGNDAVEALGAVGLSTEPGELAFLLVQRAIAKAAFDLVGESASLQSPDTKVDADALIEQLDFSISTRPFHFDRHFLDRPSELHLVKDVQVLLQGWLEEIGINQPSAKAIAERFPTYFTYALHEEWRRNAKGYAPLLTALDTPFAKATDREWAWEQYSAMLQRRIEEGVFDEPFSLSQIYVPLNATYVEEPTKQGLTSGIPGIRRKVVVSLDNELDQWLNSRSRNDLIRVISGGPGSGKSSFARIFSARVAKQGKRRVLFVPLHLIDPSKDLVEEIARFVRDEGVLAQNPLDPESPESNLLIIFDGLDELASQGKAAAETARAFIREVERVVLRRNANQINLRVLLSGRELVVQENECEFRQPHQILTLLPYFQPKPREHVQYSLFDREVYHDPDKLLEGDLRHVWWKKYGELTGKGYNDLPSELDREDLAEVTAQPLLNYLVALSFTRDKLDFSRDINLNAIYSELLTAVHDRGYEKPRCYGPIRHMTLEQFARVLEEVGLAAWHGDGRTTTVREIEEHCRGSGLGALLDVFQEGAKAGVIRLLAAFFFRQYGHRPSGDPTFVFTHKSFGEYLAARRIVRAIERVDRELERRRQNPDEGWEERDALKHWAQICGPSAMSLYLHPFLLNEVRFQPAERVDRWQAHLCNLFNYMLRHGMPMEQLQVTPFKAAMFQSRNAEESLLVALNACCRLTEQISLIDQSDATAFGAWFKRIQGQQAVPTSILAAKCMSLLDLSGAVLRSGDFFVANFKGAILQRADFEGANLEGANLQGASLEGANLAGAHLLGAGLSDANLRGTNLEGAGLGGADLGGADLAGASLRDANLRGTNLRGADLEGADLGGATLREANLRGTNLKGADLEGADLAGADLEAADLEAANLKGANLEGADLAGANIRGANFQGAYLKGANLE
jgi:uncharacterized protein YjbI with pentapeptide repeats